MSKKKQKTTDEIAKTIGYNNYDSYAYQKEWSEKQKAAQKAQTFKTTGGSYNTSTMGLASSSGAQSLLHKQKQEAAARQNAITRAKLSSSNLNTANSTKTQTALKQYKDGTTASTKKDTGTAGASRTLSNALSKGLENKANSNKTDTSTSSGLTAGASNTLSNAVSNGIKTEDKIKKKTDTTMSNYGNGRNQSLLEMTPTKTVSERESNYRKAKQALSRLSDDTIEKINSLKSNWATKVNDALNGLAGNEKQSDKLIKNYLSKYGFSDEEAEYYAKNWDNLNDIVNTYESSADDERSYKKLSNSTRSALTKYVESTQMTSKMKSSNKIGNPLANEQNTLKEQIMSANHWTEDKFNEYAKIAEKLYNQDVYDTETEEINNAVEQGGAKTAALYSGLDLLYNIPTGVEAIGETISQAVSGEHDPYALGYRNLNRSNAVEEAVSNSIDSDLGKFAYSTGMSTAKSLETMAAGGVVGGAIAGELGLSATASKVISSTLTLPSFGASSFQQTYKENLEAGLGEESSLKYAYLSGLNEMLFEEISLDHAYDIYKQGGKALLKKGFKSALTDIAAQSGIEGSEEVFTELANIAADNLINKDFSQYNRLKEQYGADYANNYYIKDVALSGAGGAISGGVIGAGASVSSIVNVMSEAKAVKNNQSEYDNAVNNALEMDKDSKAYKLALKASNGSQLSTLEVADMLASAQGSKTVSEAVKEELVNNGLSEKEATKSVERVAEAISSGDTSSLTDTEAALVENITANDEAYQSEKAAQEVAVTGQRARAVEVRDKQLTKAYNKYQREATKEEQAKEKANLQTAKEYEHNKGSVTATTDSGKTVEVLNFVDGNIEKVNAKVNGKPVQLKVDEINFKNADGTYSNKVAQLYNRARVFNDTKAANIALETYKGQDTESFINLGQRAFVAGQMLENMDSVSQYTKLPSVAPYVALNDSNMEYVVRMFNYGKELRAKQLVEDRKKATYNKDKAKQTKAVRGTVDDSKVTNKEADSYKVVKAVTDKLSKKLGVNIVLTDGTITDESGSFASAIARITVNTTAPNALNTLLHETGEFGKAYNPEGMKQVVNAILEYMATMDAKSIDRLAEDLKAYTDVYRATVEKDKTIAQSGDEYVFDFMAGVLTTEEGMKDFLNFLDDSDYSAKEKNAIVQFISDLWDKLVEFLSNITNTNIGVNRGQEVAKKSAAQAKKFRDMWFKAVEGAAIELEAQAQSESQSEAEQKENYSVEVNKTEEMSKAFSNELDKWNRSNAKKTFTIGMSNNVLAAIGVEEGTKITMDGSKIIKIQNDHPEMTNYILKQIPNLISEPVIILQSKQSNTRIVMAGEVYDNNDKPVIAILELEPKGKHGIILDEIKVASAYAKESFQNMMDSSKVLYVSGDKTKTTSWENRTQLQLPFGPTSGSNSNIASSGKKSSHSVEVNSQGQQLTNGQKEYFANSSDDINYSVEVKDALETDSDNIRTIPSYDFSRTVAFFGTDEEIAAAEKREDEIEDFFRKIVEADDFLALRYHANNGNDLILARSTRDGVKWQLSRMDDRGAIGHEEFKEGQDNKLYRTMMLEQLFAKDRKVEVYTKADAVRHSVEVNVDDIIRHGIDTDLMDLLEDNYQDTIDILEKGAAALKDIYIDEDEVRALAKKVVADNKSKYPVEELTSNLMKVFAYMKETKNASYDVLLDVVKQVATPIVNDIHERDLSASEDWKKFRDYMQGQKISLSDMQKKEVAYSFGSYNDFKRKLFGVAKFSDTGISLDSIWSEIVEASGNQLDVATADTEQPIALARFIENYRPSNQADMFSGMDREKEAYNLAMDIFAKFFEMQAKATNINASRVTSDELVKKALEYRQKYKETYEAELKKQKEILKKKHLDDMRKLLDDKKTIAAEFEKIKVEEGDNLDPLLALEVENDLKGYDEKIEALKAQDLTKIAKEKARAAASKHKYDYAQARTRTALKNSLKSNINYLNGLLGRPKNKQFIPTEMVQAVIDVVSSINIDTGRSKATAERLSKLQNLYDRYNNDSFAFDYDERTANNIKALRTIFEGRNYSEFTNAELEMVLDMVKSIRTQISNANKLLNMKTREYARDTAREVNKEIKGSRKYKNAATQQLNRFLDLNLNAQRWFRKTSGYNEDGAWMEVYKMLDDGLHTQMQIERDVNNIFKDVLEGSENQKQLKKLSSTKKEDLVDIGLTDENGKPVMVTRDMRLALIMHLKNESNLRHMMDGGFKVPELHKYAAGKIGDAYGEGDNYRYVPYSVKQAAYEQNSMAIYDAAVDEQTKKLKDIENDLSDWEKAFIKDTEEFLWRYSGKVVNETSTKLKGYSIARVKNYMPIHVDSNFVNADVSGLVMDRTIEGQGFLKERVNSGKPIYLEGLTNVILKQVQSVSSYAGMAVPIRNLNMLLNVQMGEDTLRRTIEKTWSKTDLDYLTNLMKDLQGGRNQSDSFSFLKNKFAGSIFALNASVAIKQAASFPTAAATLGYGSLAKTLLTLDPGKANTNGRFALRKGIKELEDINPLLWYRSQGYSTQELGDLKEKSGLSKVMPYWLDWISMFDIGTVRSLEYASKDYVDRHYKALEKGSEEYWQKVSDVFTKAVEETQPNYTSLQRADVAKKGGLWPYLVMFKTQSFQNFGIMTDATGNLVAKSRQYKLYRTDENKAALKAARNQFVHAVTSQLLAAAVYNIMGKVASIIIKRKKEEDQNGDNVVDYKDFMHDILFGSLETLAGSVAFGSEIYDAITAVFTGETYYGVDIQAVASITDLVEDIQNVFEMFQKRNESITSADKETYQNKLMYAIEDLANGLGYVFGVPVSNLNTLLQSMYLYGEDALTDNKLLESKLKTADDVVSQKDRTYNALVSGEDTFKQYYNEMVENWLADEDHAGKTEDDAKTSINSSFVSRLKTDYLAGNIKLDKALKLIKKLGYDDEKIEDYSTNWQMAKAGNELGEDYTLSEYVKAMRSTTIDSEKQDSKILSEAGKQYKAGTASYEETYSILTDELGYDDEAALKKMDSWSVAEINSDDSLSLDEYIDEMEDSNASEDKQDSQIKSKIKDSFEASEISKEEAMEYLVNDAGYEETDAYWQTESWQYGSKYGHLQQVFDEGVSSGATDASELKKIFKEYEAYGMEAKDIAGKVGSDYSEDYVNGKNKANIYSALINVYRLAYGNEDTAKKKLNSRLHRWYTEAGK